MTSQSPSQHADRSATGRLRLVRVERVMPVPHDAKRLVRLAALFAIGLGSLLVGSLAGAAEVVEVRVGRHAEFTRIVFELDRPAGYRIERANPSPGVSELVISLEASSIPRRIQVPKKSLIEKIDIEPAGARSVARVRLTEGGLRLKEMLLASPPRIVLDVVSDAPEPKAASAPAPTRTASKSADQKRAAERAESERASKEAAEREAAAKQAAAKREADAKREAEAKRVAAQQAAAKQATPTPTQPSAEKEAKDKPAASEREAERRSASATPSDRATGADSRDSADAGDAADGDGVMELLRSRERELGGSADAGEKSPIARMRPDSGGDRNAGAAGSVPKKTPTAAAAEKRKPEPMVARGAGSDDGGWMLWTIAGVAGVVLLAGGGLVLRRRRGGEEVDFGDGTTGADYDDAPVPFGETAQRDGQGGAEANPFADLAGADEAGETTVVSTASDRSGGAEAFAFGEAAEAEEKDKDMDGMDVASQGVSGDGFGGMPAMGGMPDEIQQMMREMNRRVEALETRIDELVDARDRLERQVAAQTEELRVQRAAIARTQRAVRNLARPEDEPEVTEPALREPRPPGGEG